MKILSVTFILFAVDTLAQIMSENKEYWVSKGQKELTEALTLRPNEGVAQNVIIFIGDGMGISTITAARIFKGQMNGEKGEDTQLYFESFPYVALSKTYGTDRQTTDSSCTATAILSGVKGNYGTMGVDVHVSEKNCSLMANGTIEKVKVDSILDWSLAEGKSVGIVTTSRVTHATPGAAYAHTPERDWESDANVKDVDPSCVTNKVKDIALQLIEDNPNIQVIMGGGRRHFMNRTVADPEKGTFNDSNNRLDGRDLIQEWIERKKKDNKRAQYVWNKSQFDNVSAAETDFLFGLFNPSHMEYELDRDPSNEPSLSEMTTKAIEILRKNAKGFFLLVEGARIDHAHHDNNAKRALADAVAMDNAVRVAKEMTGNDTLIIVTADHSHVFTIAGYPSRGNNILGVVDLMQDEEVPIDQMPYETLSYANGPGHGRINLTGVDTTDKNYKQGRFVQMLEGWETHGGEDVAIFATGPMAHLFHRVHEQSYIAHVMAYASCVGTNKEHCQGQHKILPASSAPGVTCSFLLTVCVLFKIFTDMWPGFR